MSIEQLGSIGEFIASIAVVISLLYLARQMRQNTSQLSRNEMNATHEQVSYWRHAIVENADLAEIWHKGVNDEALTPVEETRLHFTLQELAWTLIQWRDRAATGAIDPIRADEAIEGMHTVVTSSERFRKWWRENKRGLPREFMDGVDRRGT
jgi:hypothetical protein